VSIISPQISSSLYQHTQPRKERGKRTKKETLSPQISSSLCMYTKNEKTEGKTGKKNRKRKKP